MSDKTAQELAPFRWSPQKEKAALLVALDEVNDQEIADEVGIARTTLYDWKKHPEFTARTDAHVADFRRRVRASGIAIIENRVRYLQDRHRRMCRIIEARGADPKMQGVPGGDTGLLVHEQKSVGSGPTAKVVDTYTLDAALLRELREHEQQAAKELGQWTEKQDVTSGGKPLAGLDLSKLTVDELRALRELRLKASVDGKPSDN